MFNFLSFDFLKKHKIIPVSFGEKIKFLKSSDFNLKSDDIYNLSVLFGKQIEFEEVDGEKINELIDNLQKKILSDGRFDENALDSIRSEIEILRKDILDDKDGGAAVDAINKILLKAIQIKASDIHIEPLEENISVRFRVDGNLKKFYSFDISLLNPLIARVKILANLDISEKRLPQDGRINITVGGKKVDIRTSVIPTSIGERAVLRILDKSSIVFDLASLGFEERELAVFKKNIKRQNGLIIMTGPTGSGKTTTLYCFLQDIAEERKNIITLEDPVEYKIDGINQMEVKPSIGFTFASGLRAILRQDPDVILVGEIRDAETAELAAHSSLTGHLVLTTLHTNSAAGALTRLLDLGLKEYIINSTLNLAVGQRLVRKLCLNCRIKIKANKDFYDFFGLKEKEEYEIYTAGACESCSNTGYSGRTVIAEVVEINDDIKNILLDNCSEEAVVNYLKKKNIPLLKENAFKKILSGITSFEEAAVVI